MEETLNELHHFLIKLEDPNKVERKRNLQKILEVLTNKYPLGNDAIPSKNHREVCVLWNEKLHVPILRRLRDESERVRELSAEIVLFFFGHMSNSSPMTLSYIIPVLKQRLVRPTPEEVVEPSEEVRLLLLQILSKILQKTDDKGRDDLKIYLNDLMDMTSSCIIDSFADIKELACANVGTLADKLPSEFHFNAANLINPLASAMTHQQKKVRVACIQATGVVIQHSGFDQFQLIASHLAQRLFDPVPAVRLQVSKVAAQLLLEWNCAMSCASMLIPLLLTSLEDETPMNREETWNLWNKVGKKWVLDEASRDAKLKEQLDFQGDAPPPPHYPTDIKRSNFGCRKYITKVILKLIPALKNDLGDWLVETRIKTSQLTYILVCHMEETCVIAQHADSLLGLFFQGVKDNEVAVMKNMCRAAKVYGYFVPPKFWCPLMNQRLLSQATYTDLMVLSHIISGSDPVLLRGNLEDIALTLQDDSVCQTSNDAYLDCLLECVLALIKVCGADCDSVRNHLFKLIMTIDGLCNNADLQESANQALDQLANAIQMSRQELLKRELGPALTTMKMECQDWTAASFRVGVFAKMLSRSGVVLGYYPDLIISIFHQVLDNDPTAERQPVEAELKLKMFLTLSKLLCDVKNTLDSQNEFKSLAMKIVVKLILPNIKWQAGRKAEAVRIAAVSSLWSLFASSCLDPIALWENSDLINKLIPSMNRLLEDDAVKIRLFICQCFQHLFDQGQLLVPLELLVKISSFLLKRLDDVNDQVRLACLQALSSVVHCLPSNMESRQLEPHLKGVYTSLLLHMDDSNQDIRKAALETLRVTGGKCPELLLDLTSKAASKHVHKDQCNQLIEHLQGLHV